MSRRESWDWETETTYTSRGVRRPRPGLVDHDHQCPDGTVVRVTAQYVEMTDVTLYRWWIGGVVGRPTSRRGDHRVIPPDWARVDSEHRVAA